MNKERKVLGDIKEWRSDRKGEKERKEEREQESKRIDKEEEIEESEVTEIKQERKEKITRDINKKNEMGMESEGIRKEKIDKKEKV